MVVCLIEDLKMKEFYIGQKVVVSDIGGCYSSFRDMAKLMKLSNWKYQRQCPTNEPLTIIAKEVHKSDGFHVYGLEDSNGQTYMSSARYFLLSKPARTEYVKVTESIFDLKEEFERGELYFMATTDCEYHKIDAIKVLGLNFDKKNIYRRIEKEVDWSEAVSDYFFETKWIGIDCSIEESIAESNYREEFLEMCRVVLRATGELPE